MLNKYSRILLPSSFSNSRIVNADIADIFVRIYKRTAGCAMLNKKDNFITAGLGIQFALIMCLGFFGGQWLDERFDMSPLFLLLCCAAAFALGIYIIVKSAKIIAAATEEKK
jgi:F0F1-type ATP synthase assembly protein I